ncbi:uncharacterized protein LOC123544234 isoform X1 [Mercenaria mercenaria]|uniref:uncharacterized protein LOC123544234 isoform X1 n=1 Tax=Mercenaria mercenaria TaxID=6596 RepID=UPI00234F55E0|nr:uncharacterized protein LOC123544234 isoform X1 [Mercenaria mercenaria]
MMEDWLFGGGDEAYDKEMVLQFTDSSNTWMTLPEERGISLSIDDLKASLDPVLVAMVLHHDQLLPESTYNVVMRMFQKGIKRENICEYLIKQLPSTVRLQNLTKVLDRCGYTDLSAKLVFNSFKWNSAYTCVSNPSNGSIPSANRLYTNLKRLVNNAQLSKPRRFLRKMANRCYLTMTKEMDPRRKQTLADQCIAIIGAETDTIAITFDKTLCRHVLFTQMKHISRETSNTLISDLVYYGRLANAYAIAGDYKMCEQILHGAKCKAYITGPCIEFVNLVYIIAYVTLWQFEKYPTAEYRSNLLMWGRIGLKCVEEDFVDNKNQWRRNLLLRMILCLLGLGNRATVIEDCPIDESSITEAKLLLAEFDKYWDGIETRRKMFYYVAKARLCELEKRPLDCLQYLRIAFILSMKGNFEEIRFISAYYNNVEEIGRYPEFCRRIYMKHADQIQVNPPENLAQGTIDHELVRKEVHFDRTLNQNFTVIRTQDIKESCQVSSSLQSKRRIQPIGCSNVSQNTSFFNIQLTTEQQKKAYSIMTKCCEDDSYFPSSERSPPSGDSQPGSPVDPYRNHGNDTQLEYAARTREADCKNKNIETNDRDQANKIIDGEYPGINNYGNLEKEHGTGQIKDNNTESLGYSGEAFPTYDRNAIS